MTIIEVNGKMLEVDEEGYLLNFDEWEPAVAEVMAKQDELRLDADHWEIINWLREYFTDYQISPNSRVLTKAATKHFGVTKGTRYLCTLFPLGPAKQGSRYAGLPFPVGEF